MALESYTFVLLRRPADRPERSDAEWEELQKQHLAHLNAMYAKGMLIAGPFRDQPDQCWRGLCLYRTNVEETRRLAEVDPMVRARGLDLEIFTWMAPAGILTFAEPDPETLPRRP